MWNDDGDDDDDDDASAHNVVKCEQVRGGINCILGHASSCFCKEDGRQYRSDARLHGPEVPFGKKE